MNKLNVLFWTTDWFDIQTVNCFSGYYGFSYFRRFSHYASVRNFYKL